MCCVSVQPIVVVELVSSCRVCVDACTCTCGCKCKCDNVLVWMHVHVCVALPIVVGAWLWRGCYGSYLSIINACTMQELVITQKPWQQWTCNFAWKSFFLASILNSNFFVNSFTSDAYRPHTIHYNTGYNYTHIL